MNINTLVSQEELTAAFEGTNFGDSNPREIIKEAVLKQASGFESGSTVKAIMRKLGLFNNQNRLTKTGKRYLWFAYKDHDEILKERKTLILALHKIGVWELPVTGKFWDDGSPMSYGACYGSSGERDYFKEIAMKAIRNCKIR